MLKHPYKNKKILEKEISQKLNQNEYQEVFNIVRQNNSSLKYSEKFMRCFI